MLHRPESSKAPAAPSAESRQVINAALTKLGRAPAHVAEALVAWASYVAASPTAVSADGATVAALDYIAARRLGQRITQKHIAREHGVTANALSVRYSKIRLRLL